MTLHRNIAREREIARTWNWKWPRETCEHGELNRRSCWYCTVIVRRDFREVLTLATAVATFAGESWPLPPDWQQNGEGR